MLLLVTYDLSSTKLDIVQQKLCIETKILFNKNLKMPQVCIFSLTRKKYSINIYIYNIHDATYYYYLYFLEFEFMFFSFNKASAM